MKLIKLIKSFKSRFDEPVLKLCSKSRFLAGLYYAFWNGGFSYEQRAYLIGRQVYKQKLNDPSESLALLRRNIHRIEKGLIMRPRRDVFALDYIAETVAAYCKASSSGLVNMKEMQWATDVLGEYFNVCQLPTSHEHLNNKFITHRSDCYNLVEKQIPYLRDLDTPPTVSYDDLKALAIRRRSVRWFLDKKVPRELVDQAGVTLMSEIATLFTLMAL